MYHESRNRRIIGFMHKFRMLPRIYWNRRKYNPIREAMPSRSINLRIRGKSQFLMHLTDRPSFLENPRPPKKTSLFHIYFERALTELDSVEVHIMAEVV